MAKRYLIWKGQVLAGASPEWLEISGTEFFRLFNSPESKGRFFIVLDNDICTEADVLYMEATEEQYRSWYKENCHHLYLKKFQPKNGLLSLDAPTTEEEFSSLHDIVADISVDIAADTVHSIIASALPAAINGLNEKHREAILAKYFQYPDLSDDEIAKHLGLERRTFCKRKANALAALKNFLEA